MDLQEKEDGWTKVESRKKTRNHGNQHGFGGVYTDSLFTLFVENLPNEMDDEWLFQLFSAEGEVAEAFIPNKRSKKGNCRFGFVRFYHKGESLRAISNLNGLVVRECKMLVMYARFLKQQNHNIYRGSRAYGTRRVRTMEQDNIQRGKYREYNHSKSETHYQGRSQGTKAECNRNRSFAEVVSNKNIPIATTIPKMATTAIKVQEVATAWLTRSVVVRISSVRSLQLVQDQLRSLGYVDIQVRQMGGDVLVLTFPSEGAMNSMLEGGSLGWIKEWFIEVHKWKDAPEHKCSRLVWLNCYGVPLNLWNAKTFFSIGQRWGNVVSLEDSTAKSFSFAVGKVLISTTDMEMINETVILESKGKLYKIRVVEEQLVSNVVLRIDCNCNGCKTADSESENSSQEIEENVDADNETMVADSEEEEKSVEMVVDSFEGILISTAKSKSLDLQVKDNEDNEHMGQTKNSIMVADSHDEDELVEMVADLVEGNVNATAQAKSMNLQVRDNEDNDNMGLTENSSTWSIVPYHRDA